MSISKSLARLTPIAAACCAVFAAVPASAAVVASFDPAYNSAPGNPDPDMNNIGYKGSITLDLTGCSTTSGYTYTSNGYHYPYGSCAISVDSAHIDFYNSTTDPVTQTPIASIDLAGSFFDSDYVYGAYFDTPGHLASFDTYVSDPFYVTITDGGTAPISYNSPDPTSDYLQLQFVSGQETCDGECTSYTAAYSFSANVSGPIDPGYGGFLFNTSDSGQSQSQPATVTILDTAAIPEPESIALTLLGFGAMLFSRRRRATSRRTDQAEASRPPISAA